MKKLLFLKLLALVACLSSALSASAYDFSAVYNATTFYYNIRSTSFKTVEVTYNRGEEDYRGSVVIPSSVTYNGTTYEVYAIGDFAFSNCPELTYVSIPLSVEIIGQGAFGLFEGDGYGSSTNQLTSITLSDNVRSIGANAFLRNRKLHTIVIGGCVTTIGEGAFQYCEALQNITIGGSVTSIGANAFYGAGYHYNGVLYNFTITCNGYTPPTIQSNTFPSEFYTYATLKVPSPYCKTAYHNATYWSNFNTNRMYAMQPYDFINITGYESNNDIYCLISGSNTVKVVNKYGYDATSSYYGTDDYSYTGDVNIPTSAGYYPGAPTTLYNVTAIGAGAFRETPIMMLNSPADAPSLRDQGDLKSVNVGNNVATIERDAFRDCNGLKTVRLGTGVTSIGTNVFNGCTSLISVYSNRTTPPTITSSTFDNSHYATTKIYVPKSAINSYKAANYWKNFYLILPNDGTSLSYALNVSNGNINFTSTGDYPWTVKGDATRVYAQSSNAGVASSTSTLSATVSLSKAHTITFDFKAWGEGTNYDVCIFSIDGTEQFRYGARDNDWESYSATVPSGSHTLTWTYQKDSSVNPTGDYFAVDNVKLTEVTIVPGDVNGDGNTTIADVSALIDVLLGSSAPSAGADVNGDGQVSIADVSALIDLLLN